MEPAPPLPNTAVRVLCSLPVIASGAAALLGAFKMSSFEEIFENMIQGGVNALPPATRWLLENRMIVMALAVFLLAGMLWIIWRHRNINLVLAVSLAASSIFILVEIMMSWILQQSMVTFDMAPVLASGNSGYVVICS